MKFGKRGQVSHLHNHVGQIFSRSVHGLQSSDSRTWGRIIIMWTRRVFYSCGFCKRTRTKIGRTVLPAVMRLLTNLLGSLSSYGIVGSTHTVTTLRVTATAVNHLRECVRSLCSVDAVQYMYTSHTRDTSAAAALLAVCARTRKLQTVRPGVSLSLWSRPWIFPENFRLVSEIHSRQRLRSALFTGAVLTLTITTDFFSFLCISSFFCFVICVLWGAPEHQFRSAIVRPDEKRNYRRNL